MFLTHEGSLIVFVRTLSGFTGNSPSSATTASGIYPQLMRSADRTNRLGEVRTAAWGDVLDGKEGFHVKLRWLTHICEEVCG